MRVHVVWFAVFALSALAAASCARMAPARADRPPLELLTTSEQRPVILLHGFSGFADFGPGGQYFAGVKAHYEAQGVPVFVPALPPYAHSEERAVYVARAIDDALRESGADKVHLIAHSQGGIDARYAISEHGLGYADKVASLTTISTPHRGTPLADLFAHLPRFALDVVFVPMALVMGAPAGKDLGGIDVHESLRSMSTSYMARFNEEHPDPAGVPLFSVATLSGDRDAALCHRGEWDVDGWDAPSIYLAPTWVLLSEDPDPARREPNDGVVPVASAMRGRFLGCVAADHLEVVGFNIEVENAVSRPFDRFAFFDRLLGVLQEVDAGVVDRSQSQVQADASLVEMRRESP